MNKLFFVYLMICAHFSSLYCAQQNTQQIIIRIPAVTATHIDPWSATSLNESYPSDQGDGSYHLMHKGHWEESQSRTFNVGDIIITSKELQDRVKYSVHGDAIKTQQDPTNAECNWSTIVKAGTVTLMSTFYHGRSEPRTEKKNITVK